MSKPCSIYKPGGSCVAGRKKHLCDSCQFRLSLDDHPLAPFFQKVAEEYERGLAKYGPWENIPIQDQVEAVFLEFEEWCRAMANRDIHGEHGQLAELTHLANVAGRRWTFLRSGQKGE